jgi:hypothetical protein
MKKIAGCAISQCPGIYDPADGSGDLLVIGRNAVFNEAYMNSDIAAGPDEVALTISRSLVDQTADTYFIKMGKAAHAYMKGCAEFDDDVLVVGELKNSMWDLYTARLSPEPN